MSFPSLPPIAAAAAAPTFLCPPTSPSSSSSSRPLLLPQLPLLPPNSLPSSLPLSGILPRPPPLPSFLNPSFLQAITTVIPRPPLLRCCCCSHLFLLRFLFSSSAFFNRARWTIFQSRPSFTHMALFSSFNCETASCTSTSPKALPPFLPSSRPPSAAVAEARWWKPKRAASRS